MFFKSTPKKTDKGDKMNSTRTYSRPRRRNEIRTEKSRATTVMKALSNSQRLTILSHLIYGEELSVKELEDIIRNLSQSALSQHLGRLRRANILKARRDSQMVYYSIQDENVAEIIALLNQMYESDPVLRLGR